VPSHLRRRFAGVLLLLAAAMLASCGGSGGKEDAQDLLDKAFKADINSADVKLDATIQVKGAPALERPVRVQASGPFRSNEGKLPSVDMDIQIGTSGGGQTVQTGFLSTGDRAFVKFQDVYYEQPPAEVRKANASIRKNQGKGQSLGSLGLDPRKWIGNAKEEGNEKVAGTDVRHVSGTLDMSAFLNDLNEFVRRSSGAIGGATGQTAPKPLGADDIAKVEQVVQNPSFDVYVAEEDDTIRRVAGRIEFAVPEEARSQSGGLESGSFEFSLELSDVNGDQEIRAPEKARPLSDLTGSLGGSGLQNGLGGGSGGGGTQPQAPQPQTPPPTSTGGTDTESFKKYSECLEKAKPEDTAALQRCSELLQTP
jgi:hypothetical protein